MELQTVRRRVRTAISNLIVEDYRLLTLHSGQRTTESVAERSLSAAFAWQLKRVFDSSWDVDCEYNRQGSGEDVDIKRVRREEEGDRLSVSPDVIVHRRGEQGPENNLLVIEMKKTGGLVPPQRGRGGVDSLAGARADLGYQHGLFLSLGLDRVGHVAPQWAWVRGFAPGEVKGEHAVYNSPANLDALVHQGAELAARRYGPRIPTQPLLA